MGLYCSKNGVDVVSQNNAFGIQTVTYDLSKETHALAIHSIFKYLSLHRIPPARNALLRYEPTGYIRHYTKDAQSGFDYMKVVYNCYKSRDELDKTNITKDFRATFNKSMVGLGTGQPLIQDFSISIRMNVEGIFVKNIVPV